MIRPRFSIRAIFFVITALAVGMAIFIVPGIEKQRTIERLESLGVDLNWDEGQSGGPAWARCILGELFFINPQKATFRRPCADHGTAFELITRLPSISSVSIGFGGAKLHKFNTPLSPNDFVKLKKLAKLDSLYAFTPIGDDAAIGISELNGLKTLVLFKSDISDRGAARLATLTNLQFLSITDDPSISDSGLQQLILLKDLQFLILRKTSVVFHVSCATSDLQSLVSLVLENTNVDDEGISNLKGLQQLRSLNLRQTPITGRSIDTIANLRALEDLTVDGTKITNDELNRLQGLRALRSLDLSHTVIDDRGLVAVSMCKTLETLYLDGTKITDGGLAALANLPHLYELSIQNTSISDRGLKTLDSVHTLMVVDAQGTQITQAGVAAAAAYSSDRQVEISNPTGASVP